MNIKNIIKNFSYSLGANFTSFLLSTMMILLVPKLIGVSEYGYWQLYTFYSGYVGYFQLGLCDGVYLRYGGRNFNELNTSMFQKEFYVLFLFEIITSILLYIGLCVISPIYDKKFVISVAILSISIVTTKNFLSYTLQATNKIKEYSKVLIIEKLIYGGIVFILLLFGVKSYKPIILADFIGKLISLVLVMKYCKKIIFHNTFKQVKIKSEVLKNLNAGSKLMLASIAGMLILGIIRICIENHWSIEVFGRVSLSISASNMMMVFINAMGIVIFPLLKKFDMNKMKDMYELIRNVLMFMIFFILLFYYPLAFILTKWLPQYSDSLRYMALLFPICVFESKVTLLINTYLKALRKEKLMLYCNLFSVLISLICTYICVYLLNNLLVTIVSIVILLGFRCILSEIILSKYINVNLSKDIVLEVFMSIGFMLIGWLNEGVSGFLLYAILLCFYIYIKRIDLSKILIRIRKEIWKEKKE